MEGVRLIQTEKMWQQELGVMLKENQHKGLLLSATATNVWPLIIGMALSFCWIGDIGLPTGTEGSRPIFKARKSSSRSQPVTFPGPSARFPGFLLLRQLVSCPVKQAP